MNQPISVISIELTNRCNLKCYHCFTGRHGGRHDLPLKILQQVLARAHSRGFTHISFTGGDPMIYRDLDEVLRLTAVGGYQMGFNTNGWNFAQIYQRLLPHREALEIITFSLDGASEATHDRLRGKGSFRRVLQAMSLCVVHDLPFSINMVVTAHNAHELADAVHLAEKVGSRSLRFGHLLHSPITTDLGFDLTPQARKEVEQTIDELDRQAAIPISMAAGNYTTELFPCRALHLRELNIDCFGNLTKCCHLSNHGGAAGTTDVIGNLQTITFDEAMAHLIEENRRFQQHKTARHQAGSLADADYFPCWYCFNYYDKVAWLREKQTHSWQKFVW